MEKKTVLPYDNNVINNYIQEKSAPRLIRNSSVVFLFWSWFVILPFMFYENKLFNRILIFSTIAISIIILFALFISNKNRSVTILLFGIESLCMSILHLLLVFGILSLVIGYNAILVCIFSILGYILAFLALTYYHHHALNQDKYRKKKAAIGTSLIPFASISGLTFGKSLKGLDQNIALIILSICFWFFIICFIYGTHNIYKFILIKKYNVRFKD